MKKYMIIVLLMLFMLPVAFAGVYTDTSRNYFTQKCYSGGTGDCFSEGGYLLNNYMDGYYERQYNIQYPTNTDSRVEYNSSTWSSCNLVAGGSKYRGLPFNYDDPYTNYTFSSFIRLRNLGNSSYIEQINSNCQIFDQWGMENTSIVSQLGMINKGNEYGMLPFFAYAYNKTTDGNVYMRVFTLENDTNVLKYLGDFFIADWEEFGDYESNMGVAGGAYYSDENDPSTSGKLVFGIYSKLVDSLFILYGHANYPYFSHSEIVDIPDFKDLSTNHQLYFDDYDQDGNNEFILLSVNNDYAATHTTFQLNRVTPSLYAPYYYLYPEINLSVDITGGVNEAVYNVSDGDINLCQMGLYDSPMEVCYSGGFDAGGVNIRNYFAIINETFTSSITSALVSSGTYGRPESLSIANNSDNSICVHTENDKYKCYSASGSHTDSFTVVTGVQDTSTSHIIIGELDGNYDKPELIFSSGIVETINFGSTNTLRTKWENTFTNSQRGNLWLQDISGDNRNELIYMDDTFLRIYSMNHTPATFLSYEELLPGVTTTTAPGSTTTTTINADLPEIFSNVQNNINLLIGLILIIGLCLITAAKTQSTIIIALAGVVGTIMAATLGLISTGVIVIIVISLICLTILGLTLLRGSSGG
jgi:hypothetical protein